MSRLQGWTAFDGLPGDGSVAAQSSGDAGGGQQQQNAQHAQQQQQLHAQRYSPLSQMTSSALNTMGSPSSLRIQPTPVCPPRTVAPQQREEAFLKPVAENKDPNPAQMQMQQQQQQQGGQLHQPSAPQSPPQQQRPIGPAMGYQQMSEMPLSPSDLLMRNEMVGQGQMRTSPQHTVTPQAPPSSPQVPNLAQIPGFQSLQQLHSFDVQYQNSQGGLRFSRPSSGSPSPSSSPSPFHNHNQQYGMHGSDDVADLLAASHLDASAHRNLQLRGSQAASPQQHMFAHEYMEQQQGQQQGQMQSERGAGWQFPEVPPKGYKTVICKFWENNMCTKGSGCTFAHGTEDLKRFAGSGPAYRNMAGPGLPSALKMDRYKTKLCLFHMQSRCCKGPHCPYAHGIEELRASMPPAVLNALHHRFGLPGMPNPTGTEFPSGPQDDQALRAYVDEFQLQQMMQMQGMPAGMQGMQGGVGQPNLAMMQQAQQQGMGAMGMPSQGMGAMGGAAMGMLQGMGGPGQQQQHPGMLGGFDDGGLQQHHDGLGMLGGEKEGDIDQQQQMAAMKYFDRQGQMNSLQQQAQARVNMQQQQHAMQQQQQQQQQPQGIPQMQQFLAQNANANMMMQAGRGNGGGGGGGGGLGGQAGLPASVLAYRPVNLWPHGPSWQPEEQ